MAAKKKTGKKAGSQGKQAVETVDPRACLAPTQANLTATLEQMRAVLAKLPAPAEPQRLDPVDALLHIIFADGLPCRTGQVVVHRFETAFVDRNEMRVTEAYETTEMLGDLGIPDLFDRCATARASVGQLYNDQNKVSLSLLHEATVAERNSFFSRVPAFPPVATRALIHLLGFEELLFSERSTVRVQQRLGLDNAPGVEPFIEELRQLLDPFKHIPVDVAPRGQEPDPAAPELCPMCLLVRLAPPGRKR